MIQRNGWTLLFHECVIQQIRKLHAAVERARKRNPQGYASNSNVKLFNALSRLILKAVPSDPSRQEYRIGKTMGAAYRHWRRAKIGRRFRLFYRFDTKSRIIVYAWVNDRDTQRKSGSKTDPYSVFRQMLKHGHPPDDWQALLAGSKTNWNRKTKRPSDQTTKRPTMLDHHKPDAYNF